MLAQTVFGIELGCVALGAYVLFLMFIKPLWKHYRKSRSR